MTDASTPSKRIIGWTHHKYDDPAYGDLTPQSTGLSAAAASRSTEHLFRMKPVEIIAHRIGDDGWPDEIWEGVNRNEITLHLDTGPLKVVRGHVIIKTLEGDMRGEVGDWIIRGVKGFYPCKPDIFEATYERSRLQPAAAAESPSRLEGVSNTDYVMVPREPTSEMHEAAFKQSLSAAEGDEMNGHFVEINAKIYRAMLSAAPKFNGGRDE